MDPVLFKLLSPFHLDKLKEAFQTKTKVKVDSGLANLLKDTKKGERNYVKKLTKDEVEYLFAKPFDKESSGMVTTSSYFYDFAVLLNLALPPKCGSILSVGCGTGWTEDFLAHCGLKVIGLDICKDAIKLAQKRLRKIYSLKEIENLHLKFIVGDIENPPLTINKVSHFDRVLFYDSLHHVPNWRKAIKNSFKILKKNGRLIVMEPSVMHFGVNTMKRFGNLERGIYPYDVYGFCKRIGFDQVTIYLPDFHLFKKDKGHILTYWPLNFFLNKKILGIYSLDILWPVIHFFLTPYLLRRRCIVVANR